MKFKIWLESQNIIYQDKTGYISGYKRPDGFWWIQELVIHPEFRGMHLAKNLASHLPQKCKLLAYPLMNMGKPIITQTNLIKFYTSLGFEQIQDEHGNTIMQRG